VLNVPIETSSPPPPVPAAGGVTAAGTFLILTCVDGALRESGTGSCAAARPTLTSISRLGIPLVLTSYHSAAELMAMQRELGVVTPFIAANGRTLHIPRGYFSAAAIEGSATEWDVLEFTPPSVEDALDVLLERCRAAGQAPLLVGVGASWPDHALLRHVDVPILIRSALVDQTQLRNYFPQAYLTAATGPDGWSEAILGSA
jgi:predicted mannosyl-3-phosphoglycerate phosphatase (HAD superfamily)